MKNKHIKTRNQFNSKLKGFNVSRIHTYSTLLRISKTLEGCSEYTNLSTS